ncbi:hypothetical protein TorRG33x02_135320 [Trema orientale]|uniref:Uncharacterized protein n=1 Tax=Trema orientale TaxID=63057 RepID=A0A2P5EYR1_TREOI|nr:hypothetical protein TorRG33x02_135320 [Trema orientale]
MIGSRWNLPSATNTITVSGSVPLSFGTTVAPRFWGQCSRGLRRRTRVSTGGSGP